MKKTIIILIIALFANVSQLFAQSGRVITGIVLDENGQGLPGIISRPI